MNIGNRRLLEVLSEFCQSGILGCRLKFLKKVNQEIFVLCLNDKQAWVERLTKYLATSESIFVFVHIFFELVHFRQTIPRIRETVICHVF